VHPVSTQYVFTGRIAGLGITSGVRLVIGMWETTPFGPFADVMIEEPGGRRILLAPTDESAEFIATTYTFDEVQVAPVTSAEPPPASRCRPHTSRSPSASAASPR